MSRIEALARPDKWYLGGLDGVLWAPPFPRWLHRPGFWDAAHLLQYEAGPIFSVALLDGAGAEIPLSAGPAGLRWRPGVLVAEWRTADGAPAVETRQVLPGGILESAWALPPGAAGGLLVALTAQPAGSVSGIEPSSGGVRWVRRLADRAGQELSVGNGDPRVPCPRVAPDSPLGGRCAARLDHVSVCGRGNRGHRRRRRHPRGRQQRARLALGGGRVPGSRLRPGTPFAPHALDPRLSEPPWQGSRAPADRLTWESFFAGFPAFTCGDPRLDRTFDHRIHGLGLNRIEGRSGHVRHPCIAEGIEYFHVPIAYSAQCHMMEMRWRADGREAWGSLLNFLDNQKEDGSLHGRIYPNHLERTDFYHANWGDALLAVDAMHPDPAALARAYDGLSRYAHWLNRSRDPEGSGMFTVVNHFETGQEYMSRYLAVDPEADVRGWEPRLCLKGIDVTVYAHQLFRALATLAGRVGRPGDASDWRALQDVAGPRSRSACGAPRHAFSPTWTDAPSNVPASRPPWVSTRC